MRGSGLRLLAIVFLILPARSYAQSERPQPPQNPTRDLAKELEQVLIPGHAIPRPAPNQPHLPVTPPRTFGFPEMAQAAGMIFSGRVTAITHPPATRSNAVETVAITFRVEQAIRGVTPGDDLTISQWMGLWSSGQRYRVSDRLLLFLYPPSKLGLTSCVGGPMGRFALDPWGRVLLSAQHLSAFRTYPLLGGKSRVRFSDFALAVRQARGEE